MGKRLAVGVLGIAAISGLTACGAKPSAPAPSATPSATAPASAGTPVPVSSTTAPLAAASSPAPSETGNCQSQVADWYAQSGQTTTSGVASTAAEVAQALQNGQDATAETYGHVLQGYESSVPIPACADPAHAWAPMLADYDQAGADFVRHDVAAAKKPLAAGNAAQKTVFAELATYIPGLGSSQ